ncbi:hypothetical protein, partial [Pusillimonas noertemannii]|uniref:hypothetical protein n=1 Tax=Pusillimonas noertemannii TaxID=305977 RepID=UPI003342C1A6
PGFAGLPSRHLVFGAPANSQRRTSGPPSSLLKHARACIPKNKPPLSLLNGVQNTAPHHASRCLELMRFRASWIEGLDFF